MRDDIHKTAPVPQPWKRLLKACNSAAEIQSDLPESFAMKALRWEEKRLREGELFHNLEKIEQNKMRWLPVIREQEIERQRVLCLYPSQDLLLSLIKSGVALANAEAVVLSETSRSHARNVEAHLLASGAKLTGVSTTMNHFHAAIERAMPKRHEPTSIPARLDMDQALPLGKMGLQHQRKTKHES